MIPFSSVHSVNMGTRMLLRTLHQSEMQQAYNGPKEERQAHFEQAAKWRDLMTNYDLAGMLLYR